MLKLMVVCALLYLFHDKLRGFTPHWRTLTAAGAGLGLGVLYVGLLNRLGLLAQIGRALGVGSSGALIMVLVVFALGGVATFEPKLRQLSPKQDNSADKGRRAH